LENSACYINGTFTDKISVARSNSSSEKENELRTGAKTLQRSNDRVKVVDKQLEFIQGMSGTSMESRHDNLFRCFIQPEMGASMEREPSTEGARTIKDIELLYKRIRTFSSILTKISWNEKP